MLFRTQVRAHVPSRGPRRPRGDRAVLINGIPEHREVRRAGVDEKDPPAADDSVSGQAVQGQKGRGVAVGSCGRRGRD